MNLKTFYLPFDVPLPPARWLSAGSLKCMYEMGNLRYIYFNEKEVTRMIYGAVRDENWETATCQITDEVIEENETGFTIKYTAFFQLNQIHYKAVFEIEGKDNSILFSMKGIALSNFMANRVGICVLHPITECAGKKVTIKQDLHDSEFADSADSQSENNYTATFPILVSPHQPFKKVQQIQWAPGDGVEAQLTFEGDVFETEDQRNWTDASYKTYSRPLDLPFPFLVSEGETMEQRVSLKVWENEGLGKGPDVNSFSANEIKIPFPKIGYCRPKNSTQLARTEIDYLQKVPFDHYRVELRLDETAWQRELYGALSEARELAVKLELVVFFSDQFQKELKELLQKLQPGQQFLTSILLLHKNQAVTPTDFIQQVYPIIKSALPGVKIGYGTDGFFADLNRARPPFSNYDFVSFSISPQVHAVDTRTLIENLSALPDIIRTAQTFTGDKAIHVSPVTFKKRGNTDTQAAFDPRQHTWLGAHWTLQAIKNLSGANAITFYETIGVEGIIKQNEFPPSQSEQSQEALLTPIYKVLAAIKDFQPEWIIKEITKDKSGNNLLLENKSGERLMFLISNHETNRELTGMAYLP